MPPGEGTGKAWGLKVFTMTILPRLLEGSLFLNLIKGGYFSSPIAYENSWAF